MKRHYDEKKIHRQVKVCRHTGFGGRSMEQLDYADKTEQDIC